MSALQGIQCKSFPSLKGCLVCAKQEEIEAQQKAADIAAAINNYIDEQYRIKGIINPNLEETTMAVTSPLTDKTVHVTTAIREAVKVQRTYTASEGRYTLTLSEQQAGYLIDLLHAHVAGEVARFLEPLSSALRAAGAYRIHALNTNKKNASYGGYNNRIAVVDFPDDSYREAAGVPRKSAPDSEISF